MSVSGIASASDIQTDYMKLLVAQLQNQNPLEPMDNNEMASQLAQFSELQQLESINARFADVLASATRGYANSLIGKQVSYFLTDASTGLLQKQSDIVDEVYYGGNGEMVLMVGRRSLGLESVADSLVGKEVSFLAEDAYGSMVPTSGIVEQIYQQDGESVLVVGQHKVGLEDVASSLTGKEVSYLVQTELGTTESRSGIVERVYKKDGKTFLDVGYPIGLEEVVSVGHQSQI